MSLRADVAREQAVIEELWEQVGEGASVAMIVEVRAAWAALQAAKPKDEPAARSRLDAAVLALGGVLDSWSKIEQAGRHSERRARLIKAAFETNLDALLAEKFQLELGIAQRAFSMALEGNIVDVTLRNKIMGDAQSAVRVLTAGGAA
jgi:hypothetical protein